MAPPPFCRPGSAVYSAAESGFTLPSIKANFVTTVFFHTQRPAWLRFVNEARCHVRHRHAEFTLNGPRRVLAAASMKTDVVLLAVLISTSGCGSRASVADEYKGFIDASAFDAKFLPGRCGSAPCYPSQQGYAHGAPVYFYNAGSVATASLPALKAIDLAPAFSFGSGRCVPNSDYQPMRDAYSQAEQYPLFSALPVASRVTGAVVTPFVNVVPISSSAPYTCNDVKDAEAVAYKGSVSSKFDVIGDETTAVPSMWVAIDPTAPLSPGSPAFTLAVSYAWYKDLLLTYLDGGPVPFNDKGELVAMDGVILDPAGGAAPSKTTDAKVVLLPFKRGEPGYSPIVKLHALRLPAGKVPGDFTGLCAGGQCGPKDIDLATAAASALNPIFVVSQ